MLKSFILLILGEKKKIKEQFRHCVLLRFVSTISLNKLDERLSRAMYLRRE